MMTLLRCVFFLAIFGMSLTPSLAAPRDWRALDQLIKEQKWQEAWQSLDKLARADGDEDQVQGDVRRWHVLWNLGRHQDMVRLLVETPSPKTASWRAAAAIYRARFLQSYLALYDWEIGTRPETVAGDPSDISRWPRQRFRAEIIRALGQAWDERKALATVQVTSLGGLWKEGTYPANMTQSLRDKLSLSLAQSLAQSRDWTPAENMAVVALPWENLDGPAIAVPQDWRPEANQEHPLVAASMVMRDAEAVHRQAGDMSLALELRLRLNEMLYTAMPTASQRQDWRERLVKRCEDNQRDPWAGRCFYLAATWWEAADDGTRAHMLAKRAAKDYASSFGGQAAAQLQERLEEPDFRLTAMAQDMPGRPSLQLSYRNLGRLYFRAYRHAAWQDEIKQRGAEALHAAPEAVKALLKTPATAAWQSALPATKDFKHRFLPLSLPMREKGFYTIIASSSPDFSGITMANDVLLSDLMVVGDGGGATNTLSLRAMAAANGAPRVGARLQLYFLSWGKGAEKVSEVLAGPGGMASLSWPERRNGRWLVMASDAQDLAYFQPESYGRAVEAGKKDILFTTDRALYRPGQDLLWQGVLYERTPGSKMPRLAKGQQVVVLLQDANGKVVARQTLRSDAYGTVHGKFRLPSDRLLGTWSIRAEGLAAVRSVRVEAYKRPAFSVNLTAPAKLSFNQEAEITGKTSYFFGGPLRQATWQWTVRRQARMAYRYGGKRTFRPAPPGGGDELVASGSGRTGPDGELVLRFTPRVDPVWLKDDPSLAFDYEITATVMDEGGESQDGLLWVTVAAQSLVPVLTPAKSFFMSNEDLHVSITRQDAQGQHQAGHGRWRLMRLVPPSTPRLPSEIGDDGAVGGDGRPPVPRWGTDGQMERDWQSWREKDEVASGSLVHQGTAAEDWQHAPLPAGVYRFIYVTTTPEGQTVDATTHLAVLDGKSAVALPLYLWLDKNKGQLGDELSIAWGSGFKDQTLYLDVVHRQGAVERRVLKGQQGVEKLRVAAKDRGGLRFRLYSARAHEFMQIERHITVPFADHKLKVSFSRFRSQLRPGEAERWELNIQDDKGQGALARVLMLMHDQSLDALAPYEPASLVTAFPSLAYVWPLQASVAVQYPVWVQSPMRRRREVISPEDSQLIWGYGDGFAGPGYRLAGDSMMSAVMRKSDAAAAPMGASPAAADAAPPAVGTGEGEEQAAAKKPPAPMAMRRDFSETALWQPTLQSDAAGHVVVSFVAPSALTRWRVYGQALTSDFRFGEWEESLTTYREWSVRPQVPRLWREGDRLRLRTLLRNDGTTAKQVSLRVSVQDAATGKDLSASVMKQGATGEVSVAAGSEGVWESVLEAPMTAGSDVVLKVSATGDGVSDGEEHLLPILPGRVHLMASQHAVLKDNDRVSLSLASHQDASLVAESLVVSAEANLWLSMLAAVPALLTNPYETADSWASRYVTLALMKDLFAKEAWLKDYVARHVRDRRALPAFATDPERQRWQALETPWLAASQGKDVAWEIFAPMLQADGLAQAQDKSLRRLAELQNQDGGFAWCPAGPSSSYMSLLVLGALARAAEDGLPLPRRMAERAMRYVMDQWYPVWQKEWRESSPGASKAEMVLFLSVASALTKAGLASFPAEELASWQAELWKARANLRPQLKLQLAMLMTQNGAKVEAKELLASVLDQAKQDPNLGTYWAADDQTWLWYEDTIEGHTLALRSLLALDAKDVRATGLVQWLLTQKKLNQWRSARSTVEVLHSLRAYLRAQGDDQPPRGSLQLAVEGGPRVNFTLPQTKGAMRIVVPGPAVKTPVATASKEGRGLAFVDLTYAFATSRLDVLPASDLLQVTRQVYRRDGTAAQEGSWRLLGEQDRLPLGAEVEVELRVQAKMPMDFVILKDPRPMGFEPMARLSERAWEMGVGWYREVRDEATRFYFDRLPAGRFTLRYRLRATASGTMRYEPPVLQSFFAPEVSAYDKGRALQVEPSS